LKNSAKKSLLSFSTMRVNSKKNNMLLHFIKLKKKYKLMQKKAYHVSSSKFFYGATERILPKNVEGAKISYDKKYSKVEVFTNQKEKVSANCSHKTNTFITTYVESNKNITWMMMFVSKPTFMFVFFFAVRYLFE
jgi:hypothetical protein